MERSLEDVLRMLDEVAEEAKSIRIDLDDEYRRAIAIVEAMPQNQSGADKSWVGRVIDLSARHFARAVRVR